MWLGPGRRSSAWEEATRGPSQASSTGASRGRQRPVKPRGPVQRLPCRCRGRAQEGDVTVASLFDPPLADGELDAVVGWLWASTADSTVFFGGALRRSLDEVLDGPRT